MDYKAIHQLIQWFHRTKPKASVAKNEPKSIVEKDTQDDLIMKSFDTSLKPSNQNVNLKKKHCATFQQPSNSLRKCFDHYNVNKNMEYDVMNGTQNQLETLLTKLLTRLDRLETRLLQVNRILSLSNLIERVYEVFENSSVDVAYVEFLMECYVSNVDDWRRYAIFNENKYTRNLIDSGNGKFNLILLCWSQGQTSSIHDHAQAHCLMKMLQGSLTEVRYREEPNETSDEIGGDTRPLSEISRTELRENDVCYINDSMGLHKVGNSGPHPAAVSLHLYSPPFDMCSTFDLHTGRKTKVQMSFWTTFGEKVVDCHSS
uniref:Cysteine dioxygenase n=1 Tax=Cacopsylla melanoneura TaxID=428564 RepID=A0A8D8QU29_9HEMI